MAGSHAPEKYLPQFFQQTLILAFSKHTCSPEFRVLHDSPQIL